MVPCCPTSTGNSSLTSESAQASFSSITHAGDALTFQIDDLQPIFANLGAASANVASGTGHADKILARWREERRTYYEKKLTTPATFAQKLAGCGAAVMAAKRGFCLWGTEAYDYNTW